MTDPVRQARLFVNQDMKSPVVEPCLQGQFGVFSSRCPGKETPNEDAAAVIVTEEDQLMLAVADGLGGGPDGEKAAKLALQHLRHEVQQATTTGVLLRTAIINGLEEANRAVMKIGRGAATTMAVVEIRDGLMRSYHVGDSVILLMSNRGRLKHESVSHSPVGYGVVSGMLDEQSALYHDDRHLVSNVVGCAEMRIEIGPEIKLASRDTVLLASDGLVDNLTIIEIVERARKGDLFKAVERLATDAQFRMNHPESDHPSKPDDLTMVLYRPKTVPTHSHQRSRQSATAPTSINNLVLETDGQPMPTVSTT